MKLSASLVLTVMCVDPDLLPSLALNLRSTTKLLKCYSPPLFNHASVAGAFLAASLNILPVLVMTLSLSVASWNIHSLLG